VLSFGTAGCNLGCRFCQNWDISKSRETDTLADAAASPAIAEAAAQLGCRSVAFTCNDPVIFLEYAIDVVGACHQAGVKAVAVTAGYMCAEPRAELFRHIDAANVDLKGFTGDFYRRTCLAGLDPVLETLLYLRHETGVWLEITTLLIPGLNDSDAEIDAMTRWVAGQLGPDVPVHFTAFHPDFKMRDRPPTPPQTLTRPGASPWITACATPTPATCTTRRARAPAATGAARWSSSATGTGWAPGCRRDAPLSRSPVNSERV
jgi:pyruvate formate lyase activating enzyme